MTLRTKRALALALAVLGGLMLVWLLFWPTLAFGAPPGPKGPTPTPDVKKSGQPPAAPAIAAGVDFQFSSYTARGTHPGETITYTLAVVNAGASPANAAQATINPPANAAFVVGSAHVQGGGTLASNGPASFVWTGVVGAGGAVTITYRVTLPSVIGTVVTTTASLYDPGAVAVLPLKNQLTIQAPSGGPDDFGYTYQDSLAPGSSVSFSWVPTTTPASRLALVGDDAVTGPVGIGFAFQLYTGTYTQTYINTNGLVLFGTENVSNTSNVPSPIPSRQSQAHNFASCLWNDMIIQAPATGIWVEHYGSAPNRTTVITVQEPYWFIPTSTPALFQMILSETSNRVKCQYAHTAGLFYNSGGSSGIGLENFDGTLGLQYFFGTPGSSQVTIGPLEDNLAIEFRPNGLSRPAFANSTMDVSYNVHPGDVATYTLHVRNDGNANGSAATVSNPIPPGTQFVPGSAHVQGGGAVAGSPAGVSWSGSVNVGQAVTITFRLTGPATLGSFFTDTATISDTHAAKPVVIQNPYLMQVLPPPSGGPDAFGYTYRDSYAPVSPVSFSWVPTTTPASKLNFGAVVADDVVTGPVPLGFAFDFYGNGKANGKAYTHIFISTNGLVSFGSGSTANINDPIPTIGNADNYASCFWYDLYEADASQGVWVETHGSAPNRTAVITFRTAYFETAPITTTPPALFQMILFETSNQIKCQYLDMPGPVDASGGRGATIGLENADGRAGLQYFYKQAFAPPISVGPLEPRLAVLFTPGPAAPAFSASAKGVSPHMHPGETATYTLSVANDGQLPSTISTAHDPIPPGATYVNGSAQVQGGGLLTPGPANVDWVGTVGAGARVTITFDVHLPAAGLLTNTVTISDPHSALPVVRTALTPIQPAAALGIGSPLYSYRDSYAPGVSFAWVPIGGSSPMSLTVGDPDDGLGHVPLGFAFKFFGRGYTSTLVSTNGLVMFNPTGSTAPQNQPIPTPGTVDNFATCFWADQDIAAPSQGIFYQTVGSAPHRRAVITFVVSDTVGLATAPYQYQMILREDDSGILCQYADMSGSPAGDGRHAVIGVEGPYGDAGVQYFSPRRDAPFIGPVENRLAILFEPARKLFLPMINR